jgi:D-erythro-7,8-dihydroneopterin triphosphate epimerase
MATIRIKNLRLETIIGTKDVERREKQAVVINITFDVDSLKARESDSIHDACNYRTVPIKIIALVTESKFFLLEKLTDKILKAVMEDDKVLSATVEVDKPKALSFSDSVSVELSAKR